MSATNATTNYSLPLFIGTDKPAWLVDWNSAMTAIDGQMKTNATDIQANATSIAGLSTTVSAHTTSIGTLTSEISTLSTGLNSAQGAINTIQSLIGNGEPTTTDKTIIGAINEINAKIGNDITVKTLAAGATSVEFDVPVSGDNIISFYVSDGSNYSAIDTSVSGKVTLTFEAGAAARSVSCEIQEV